MMTPWREMWPMYRRLLRYVRPYRGRLAGGLLFSGLYGPANVGVLAVVRNLWAGVFERAPGDEALGWVAVAGVALLLPVAMLAKGACEFFGAYFMNWVGLRSVMDLRVHVFSHLQKLSLDFYTGTRTGELISRVTNDVQMVQVTISNVIEDLIKEPATLVCVMGYLLYKDWKLTLAAMVLFPLCLLPILVYGRRTRKASRASQEHQASLVSVLHEAISGLRVVKAFGMEDREVADFRGLCGRVVRQRMRVVVSKAVTGPMIEAVAGVGGALVCVYAYYAGMKGSDLVTFALGLFMLYNPVKKLGRVHIQIQESFGGAERVFAVLDEQPSVVERPGAAALAPFRRVLRFENVSFHYHGEGGEDRETVLEEVDLEVPAGSLVAVVGASGSGKSTLLTLVPRFYDPAAGRVTIDGTDIREVSFASLRQQIGLVTQETFLFNDTVASNIAYGKPGAAAEEIRHAATRAHAHEFIAQMPQGYDTAVGDLGVKLSGGQRQRLAIARAILKSPPILLLDEATSALDTESERLVQAALDDLMWGSEKRQLTMLVIAHRLSTVQHADKIVVLERGRIVEQGTHQELLARGQVYKRLHDLQFPS